jgi:hypothetical protein
VDARVKPALDESESAAVGIRRALTETPIKQAQTSLPVTLMRRPGNRQQPLRARDLSQMVDGREYSWVGTGRPPLKR